MPGANPVNTSTIDSNQTENTTIQDNAQMIPDNNNEQINV
jgi:hypothetical protein